MTGKNMQAFCGNLALDAPLSRVRDMAEQNGYRMTELDNDGPALIHESRWFGRFTCEVQFEKARLMSARYQHTD